MWKLLESNTFEGHLVNYWIIYDDNLLNYSGKRTYIILLPRFYRYPGEKATKIWHKFHIDKFNKCLDLN